VIFEHRVDVVVRESLPLRQDGDRVSGQAVEAVVDRSRPDVALTVFIDRDDSLA
jgi:hypothetical protein